MFSKRLTELRNQEKLTQKELAAKLNLGRGALSLYEIGQREPDLQTLSRMADFFQVSTDYLLGRTDHKDWGKNKNVASPYSEIIEQLEKEKRTPEEFREFLVDGLSYFELIKIWRAKGLTPERVKEVWRRILEIKALL